MPRRTTKLVLEVLRDEESDAAILVADGDREFWIPRSQVVDIEYREGKEKIGTDVVVLAEMEITEWIAAQKDLV